MSVKQANKLRLRLEKRAEALSKTREFFKARGYLEVDCPLINPYPNLDTHIEPLSTEVMGQKAYLITSPEHGMKRLLSQGSGNIYQLSHVFRNEELGHQHRPEFGMIEWYRLGQDFEAIMQETLELAYLFIGKKTCQTLSYLEAFQTYLNKNPFSLSLDEAKQLCSHAPQDLDLDSYLQLILSEKIEPQFPQDRFTILKDFPPSQAALAQVDASQTPPIAKRFELYYGSIELANGYLELRDPQEQRRRFEKTCAQRQELGKEPLPLDPLLEKAMENLPPCCGVAAGFERLLMLNCKETDIAQVLPLS